MRVTELPPGPAEKLLTARISTGSLEGHFLGFLAANGFLEEKPESPLMLALIEESLKTRLTIPEFKATAYKLKKLTNGKVKLGNIQELLASVYGYKTYASLLASTDKKESFKCLPFNKKWPKQV